MRVARSQWIPGDIRVARQSERRSESRNREISAGCQIQAHLADRSRGASIDRIQKTIVEGRSERGREVGGNEMCTYTRGPSLADLGATPTV